MEYKTTFEDQQEHSLTAEKKKQLLNQINQKLDQALADEKAGKTFTANELKHRYGL